MRRTPPVVLAAAVLPAVLALATGCGRPATPTPAAVGEPTQVPVSAPATTSAIPPSSTATPTTTAPDGSGATAPDPLLATPPAGSAVVPVTQVDATGLPSGFPTTVWTRGARTLGVYGPAGGCTTVAVRVTAQDDRAIALAVVQSSNGADACTRELRYRPFEVPLAADLGARRVVLTGTAAG